MATECNPTQLEFHALGRRDVIVRIDGGRITSAMPTSYVLEDRFSRVLIGSRSSRCLGKVR